MDVMVLNQCIIFIFMLLVDDKCPGHLADWGIESTKPQGDTSITFNIVKFVIAID